jgi:regulator of protease activity HflC (stomatin/prohibitin superfamily)
MEYWSVGVLQEVRIAPAEQAGRPEGAVEKARRHFGSVLSRIGPTAPSAPPTRYAGAIRTWRNTPTLQYSITPRGRIEDDDEYEAPPYRRWGLLTNPGFNYKAQPMDFAVIQAFLGIGAGIIAYVLIYCLLGGVYTVNQNERAVITNFGRADRLGQRTTLELPIAESLTPEHRERYVYPQVRVVGPGGPYLRMPWQKVYKVSTAIQTINIAFDPDTPGANANGTILEAVTKDQLNIGLTGQIRYRISEQNIYAYLFGVKRPISHVLGYFVSILRERIANYEAPAIKDGPIDAIEPTSESLAKVGVSINDLRKNLNDLNDQMDQECLSSAARYGMVLDASLITGIDPPPEIESALAAINTAHNEVSSKISVAQASADQKIEQSKRAVEIETNRAQAEVQPLRWIAQQIAELKNSGEHALPAYLRNVRLDLFSKAKRVVLTRKEEK